MSNSIPSILVGQTWRLRNGDKTKVYMRLTPACHPFVFIAPISGIYTAITEDGRCLPDKESPGDLVELIDTGLETVNTIIALNQKVKTREQECASWRNYYHSALGEIERVKKERDDLKNALDTERASLALFSPAADAERAQKMGTERGWRLGESHLKNALDAVEELEEKNKGAFDIIEGVVKERDDLKKRTPGPDWETGSRKKGRCLVRIAEAAGFVPFTLDDDGMGELVEYIHTMRKCRDEDQHEAAQARRDAEQAKAERNNLSNEYHEIHQKDARIKELETQLKDAQEEAATHKEAWEIASDDCVGVVNLVEGKCPQAAHLPSTEAVRGYMRRSIAGRGALASELREISDAAADVCDGNVPNYPSVVALKGILDRTKGH